MDVAGIDIYHPTQDALTGTEISFGGDLARSMKAGQNYLVIETQAQGFPQWVPYPGQLRLQAFSHLASGANMVAYWHWHSIHNSAETYWKGLLSHDFRPNPTYDEAKTIGRDFAAIGPQLVNLRKTNQVAILFSNEALTAFNAFSFGWGSRENYNDVLRPIYDALYRMNVGVDFVDPSSTNLESYKLIVVPALYAAPDALLARLNRFVEDGGHVVYTFKSGFSDENVKVRSHAAAGPHRRGVRRVVHPVHHPEGRDRDEPVPAAEGQRRRPLLDGAAHADDRQGAGALRAPGVGPVRGPHREQLRQGPRDLRRLHAERRAAREDPRGRRPEGRPLGSRTRSSRFR